MKTYIVKRLKQDNTFEQIFETTNKAKAQKVVNNERNHLRLCKIETKNG